MTGDCALSWGSEFDAAPAPVPILSGAAESARMVQVPRKKAPATQERRAINEPVVFMVSLSMARLGSEKKSETFQKSLGKLELVNPTVPRS